jgi:prepilin-type N-terminal cleavage/methylation domain-containing protein
MRNHRRGFTLMEMLVVITVGSALLGTTVATLVTLHRTNGTFNDDVHSIAAIHLLARQFRDDAHAAINTAALEDKDGVAGRRFEMAPDHVVAYEFRGGVIDRIETVGGIVQSRDSFFLPTGSVASTAAAANADAGIVALVIVPATPPASASVPTRSRYAAMRIEAVLSRDHRFARLEPQGPKDNETPKESEPLQQAEKPAP